jgi:hypothetical protein
MNNKILLIAISLVVCGAILFLWPSDEKKIRGKLASLAEHCSTEQDEPVLETMKKTALAAKLCTDLCKVHIESLKIDREFSQKELTDRFLMMKKRLPDTEFNFHDIVVDIAGDDRAEVTTTLRIVGKIVDEQITDAYEIDITAEKKDGDWLFSSFTVVEFMKK